VWARVETAREKGHTHTHTQALSKGKQEASWWVDERKQLKCPPEILNPEQQGYSTSEASGPNKKITGGVRAAQNIDQIMAKNEKQ